MFPPLQLAVSPENIQAEYPLLYLMQALELAAHLLRILEDVHGAQGISSNYLSVYGFPAEKVG